MDRYDIAKLLILGAPVSMVVSLMLKMTIFTGPWPFVAAIIPLLFLMLGLIIAYIEI
jgi:hypothetical protein